MTTKQQRRIKVLMFLTILFGSALLYTLFTASSKASVVLPEKVLVDTTPEKIAALKADVIDRLFGCEGNGHAEAEGLVTIDNNQAGTLKGDDVFSYGLGQWKTDTVIAEVKARDGITISPKEAKEIAWDTPRAKALAGYTVFENPKGKGIDHWLNCANKLDLSQEVAVLKKLSR